MSENFTGNLSNFTNVILKNSTRVEKFIIWVLQNLLLYLADKINSMINSDNFTHVSYGNFKIDKNSTTENYKNSTQKIIKFKNNHVFSVICNTLMHE